MFWRILKDHLNSLDRLVAVGKWAKAWRWTALLKITINVIVYDEGDDDHHHHPKITLKAGGLMIIDCDCGNRTGWYDGDWSSSCARPDIREALKMSIIIKVTRPLALLQSEVLLQGSIYSIDAIPLLLTSKFSTFEQRQGHHHHHHDHGDIKFC